MWGEVINLLIALPVVALLLRLVPRTACRAWAGWLVVCLMVVSLHWIIQEVYDHYYPPRLYLDTEENQLTFSRDEAGEVSMVAVNRPPPPGEHRRPTAMDAACVSLLAAFAVLLLLWRAEPVAAPTTAVTTRPAWAVGVSVQAFGLAVLLGSIVLAVLNRSVNVNLLGIVLVASGYYLGRGSRAAAGWAMAFLGLVIFTCLVVVAILASGVSVDGIGAGEAPWAYAVALGVAVWALVNLVLAARILYLPEKATT